MAKAVITNKFPVKTKSLKSKDYANIKLERVDYPKVVRIDDPLPFRIKFTNIMIPGYGPNNIPGIGLQVIGYNNYIL